MLGPVRALTVGMCVSALAVNPTHSAAAPARPAAAPAPICTAADTYSPTDIDADAASDLVVGVPSARASGSIDGAGVVDIHFDARRAGQQRIQRFDESLFSDLPAPAYGDGFGSAVAFTHLRPSVASAAPGDGCADLVIGAPGYDDPLSGATGTVTIAQGSNTGITSIGAIRLSGRSPRERFGSSVVADGDDIWVGAPNRTVDGQAGAGAVDHYRVANGVASLVQTLTEDTPGIHGGAEPNDHFGAHLSVSAYGPLVVGEPDENVGGHAVDAGTVTVVFTNPRTGLMSASGTYSQDSPGVPGTAEAGDHFGSSVTSVANDIDGVAITVGVPDEALGSLRGAGAVDAFTVRPDNLVPAQASALSQNSPGVPGADEADDHFGAQVAVVAGEICIGVPGEDLGDVTDAGRALCRTGANAWTTYAQGGSGFGDLGGAPQGNAAVGTQLSRLADDGEGDSFAGGEQVVLTIPGADFTRTASGEVVLPQFLTATDSTGAVEGERYGIAATAVSNGPEYDTR